MPAIKADLMKIEFWPVDKPVDYPKNARKWNRWQHQVDYRPFKKNKFIPKPGFEVPTEANNYGMELEYLKS